MKCSYYYKPCDEETFKQMSGRPSAGVNGRDAVKVDALEGNAVDDKIRMKINNKDTELGTICYDPSKL